VGYADDGGDMFLQNIGYYKSHMASIVSVYEEVCAMQIGFYEKEIIQKERPNLYRN
jgi:hypothetical protein